MNKPLRVYQVPVEFRVKGLFMIAARTEQEAIHSVMNNVGMINQNAIHHSMDDERVSWDFPCHMKKEIDTANIDSRRMRRGEKL